MIDVFLHIPKTGGSTLNTTLRWVYGPWACHQNSPQNANPAFFLQRKKLKKTKLATGHVRYGFHQYIDCSCRYFTILRHPIRRYISRYYQLKVAFPRSSGASMDLNEFCRSDHGWSSTNQLVRYVSGREPEIDGQRALEEAKHNLTNNLVAFGLLERFDESLLLFQRRLHWARTPFYVSAKRNSGRPTIEELPEETIGIIQEHHQHDLEFYNFAKHKFETILEKEFEDFSGALRTFRRRNSIAQLIAPYLLYGYRTARDVIRSVSDY